jgi:hypothetical protein
MASNDIFEYYKWLASVRVFIEDLVVAVTRNPDDPALQRNTDELTVNGFSLKGQDIETSIITGNVFIKADLLTFAHWLNQKEEVTNGKSNTKSE